MNKYVILLTTSGVSRIEGMRILKGEKGICFLIGGHSPLPEKPITTYFPPKSSFDDFLS